MKPTIFGLAFIAILLLFTSHVVAAESDSTSWPLNRCIAQAFQTSSALKASHWTYYTTRQEYAETKSRLLPSLSANGSYTYTSETMQLDIATPPIPGYTAPHIEFGDGNIYDLNLKARIPIYAGGSQRYQASAKESAAQAAAFDLQADSLKLLHRVRRAYFEVVAAEAGVDAAGSRVARLRRHLEETENAIKAGAASEETRLTALAGLRAAEGEELRLSAAASAARLQLGNLVGLSGLEIGTSSKLESTLIKEPAFENTTRPELLAFDKRITQADKTARAAKGSYLPSLSGAVVYHYGRPGINQVENEWMDYYTFGLNVSWMLWDFGARSHRVNALRMMAYSFDATRKNAEQAFQTMLATSRTAVEAVAPVVDKMQERLVLQQEASLHVENRLKAGMATESEYFDTQDDLFEAETQWIAAVASLRAAEADLLYAQGR